nr:formamidopyrimidine-dna glycosylase [Quercus suber]
MTFDQPPHAVMHLGMTGWVKFDVEDTFYYGRENGKDKKDTDEWPPKYAKFILAVDEDGEREAVQAAFVDPRRLARIRLVDCDAADIRNESPLKENGPDPVRDKDIVTVEWLTELLGKKRVPVKALLLDQANLSGVGNWVADETLYQARLHPEQYSNTFSQEQTKRLWDALMHVCTTAVECLGDSKLFPKDWLMTHRWGMGKKNANVLPNGNKIVHLKVGGRTSAIVPSVQKKTAAVAGDVDEADQEDDDAEEVAENPAKGRKRKTVDEQEENDTVNRDQPAKKGRDRKAKVEAADVKAEDDDDEEEADGGNPGNKKHVKHARKNSKTDKPVSKKAANKKNSKPITPGSRRSTRTKSS